MVISQTVAVKKIIPQSPDTHSLRLDAYFDYKPGQFIQVTLPGDPKIRSYSFSSSPTEQGYVEITVKAEAGGHLSNLLVGLQEGARLLIKGPFGTFGLPESLGRGPITFMAAGSGVTPFRAMSKYLIDKKSPVEKRLFYSVKVPQDLIFRQEFEKWAQNGSQFQFFPTITQNSEGVWQGETGRLSEAILRKRLPNMEGIFFLCGSPDFVNAMEQLLLDPFRVPAANIRREKWRPQK